MVALALLGKPPILLDAEELITSRSICASDRSELAQFMRNDAQISRSIPIFSAHIVMS